MRTTIALDDRILVEAKRRAAASGITLGQYVEESLRRNLVSESPRQRDPQIPLFTRGTGLRAGIDPTSNRALLDALDASGDLS